MNRKGLYDTASASGKQTHPSLDASLGSELLSVLFPVEPGHGFRAREMQNWFAQGCFRNWRCLPFQTPLGWWWAGCCSSTAAPSWPRTRPTRGHSLPRLPQLCHRDLPQSQFLADASAARSSSPMAVPASASAQLGRSRTMASRAGQPPLQPPHRGRGTMALGTLMSIAGIPTCAPGFPPCRSLVSELHQLLGSETHPKVHSSPATCSGHSHAAGCRVFRISGS